MHTLLPYDELMMSAAVLREEHLRPQIQDVITLLDALHERDEGEHLSHPMVYAWRGHELQLSEFGMLCVDQLEKRRMPVEDLRSSLAQHQDWAVSGDMSLPSWFGKEWVHDQYRRLLINMSPAYGDVFPGYAPLAPQDFVYPTV